MDRTAYTRPRFVPPGFSSGSVNITIRLCWAAESTDQDTTVKWLVALERYNTDLSGQSFGTEKSVTEEPWSSAYRPRYTDITFDATEADSIAASEMFRVRVTRNVDDEQGNDTMEGDALLLGLIVLES